MATLEEKKECIMKILKRYGKELEDLIAELEGIDDTKFDEFFKKLGVSLPSKNIMAELSTCLNKPKPDNFDKVNIN